MLKIIVHGLGRLGLSVCKLATESDEFQVVAGVAKTQKTGFDFPVHMDMALCPAADVVVDCSVASAVDELVAYALDKKTPAIICTTALDDKTFRFMHEAAKVIPIFFSANMALGVNLMARLSRLAAAALSDVGFDIEIIEKHHSGKVDAPSGTANMLAGSIIDTLGGKNIVYDRTGRLQKRGADEIGVSTIRGGSIFGEHTVLFAGEGETLEIKHTALTREVFAHGVLRAAKFVAAKPAGLYGMDDLLQ